jgi:hypothetical protein
VAHHARRIALTLMVALGAGTGLALPGSAVATEDRTVACRRAHTPRVAHPDALPRYGSTTRAHVDAVLAASRAQLERAHPGLVDVTVELRGGMVWDRLPSSEVIIRMPEDDYWIIVTLGSRRQCPSTPTYWNGVPLHFVLRARA